MTPRLLTATVALAAAAPLSHAAEFYAGAGLPGVMLGLAQPLNDTVTVRADWATLGSRHRRITEEGVTYDARLGFNRLGGFADWFVAGGFRLTAGLTLNNLDADLVAQGDGVTTFNIGGRSFVADPADRFDVKVEYPKLTPYLGIGYGHRLGAGWGFVFDAGVSYGRAKVSETHSGPNLGNPAVVSQADIDRELGELRDGVAKVRYIPQISAGFSYKF